MFFAKLTYPFSENTADLADAKRSRNPIKIHTIQIPREERSKRQLRA
jgi:hypothetical protein